MEFHVIYVKTTWIFCGIHVVCFLGENTWDRAQLHDAAKKEESTNCISCFLNCAYPPLRFGQEDAYSFFSVFKRRCFYSANNRWTGRGRKSIFF